MSKDSYWFKHDSTAGRATRMRKMAYIYSHWGKGIYWDVIEMLRDQEGYKYSNDEFDLKMLADLIGCKDESKFINWYKDCIKFGLLKEDKKHFWSEVLQDNMKRWETSKNNGSKGGRPKVKKPKQNQGNNQGNNLNKTKTETIIEEDSIKEKNREVTWSKFLSWIDENKLNKDKVYAQFDKAWMFYKERGWKNTKGKEVKNVVTTIRNNWFNELDEFKLTRKEINDMKPPVVWEGYGED